MEVVDGQQRLRTLLAFIEPDALRNYKESIDAFEVLKIHNDEIAGKSFSRLTDVIKHSLLSYELSTHVLPATTGDDLVFRIFARLNSTGLSLNHQEIRNSEFHGVFKTLVYDLSFGSYDYWRKWNLFSGDDIARMNEAEAVSEYLLAMCFGIEAKNQKKIKSYYKQFDDELENIEILKKRFQGTMSEIDRKIGDLIGTSSFRRAALFYSLYAAIYDHMYGLKSKLEDTRPRTLPNDLKDRLNETSEKIKKKELPDNVQDAMDRATGDKARRDIRHKFILEALNLEPSK